MSSKIMLKLFTVIAILLIAAAKYSMSAHADDKPPRICVELVKYVMERPHEYWEGRWVDVYENKCTQYFYPLVSKYEKQRKAGG